MLEGLEATEIPWSALERTKRLDSEYFLKEHLFNASLLRKHGIRSIASCTNISDGNHFAVSDQFIEEGFPYYRGQDVVGHFFIEQSTPVSITTAAYDTPSMKRSHLKNGDVLLSIVGSIGEASLVSSERSATCSCKLAILRPQSIAPAYLASFLRSKYGRRQTQRLTRGAIQMGLLLEDMDQVLVPEFSGGFEKAISKVIADSKTTIEVAETSIIQAELTLLQALSLANWRPPEPLSYVRNSLDAFATGRLDAEYFQPKYAKLLELIEATGQACPLADLLQTNQRGKQPEYTENGLPVVNSKHVVNGEVRVDADNRYATFSDSSLLIEPGDVLINGTGVGTIGRAAPYLHPFKAIPDNHVTILRPHKGSIDPVYLAVFLNSLAGQLQVEQRFRGSSGQIELYPNDIAQFTIWVAPENIQAQVKQSVEASFQAKQSATQLLDSAKRAVEIAIENSEAAALAYLEGVHA